MAQEKLRELIVRLEPYAREHPDEYRMRVALLAMLGYAYLLAVVVVLLLVAYFTLTYIAFNWIAIKIVWIPLVLVWLVLRSLWITLPEPDGVRIQREQAPKLFDVVEEVRQSLNGPAVNHILLSDEFNAGVVQRPKLGMFGWVQNYVVIGLPLLKAFTPEEFRAVLAHEFGHLSGRHGRFSGWIYRLRASWIQILERVHQERHYAAFIFESFLNWYGPYFNAYTFVLARAQEYEADTFAAQLAGRDPAARMLIQLSTKGRLITDSFWPSFFALAKTETAPPPDPFSRMCEAIGSQAEEAHNKKWVLQELQVPTGYDDSHPSLADRLRALGYTGEELDRIALYHETESNEDTTAADEYLGELPDDFVAGYDRLWRESIASNWREQHAASKKSERRLEELQTAAQARQLNADELWERAVLVRFFKDASTALPLAKQVVDADPSKSETNFFLGEMMLSLGDEAGVKYIEQAMASNEALTQQGLANLCDFYAERGDLENAKRLYERTHEYKEKMETFYERALNVTAGDRFEPHQLSEEEVEKLRAQLSKMHGLGRTYLVRKVVEGFTESLFILGCFATYTWHEGQSGKHVDVLLNRLGEELEFPYRIMFISLDVRTDLITEFQEIPGSVILEGGDETAKMMH